MRGSLRRRGPSWAIVLDLGLQPDSATGVLRRRQKRITFKGTKQQAEKKLNNLVGELSSGEFVDPSKLTLGEWLTTWLEGRKATSRPATYARFRSIVAHVKMQPIAKVLLQRVLPSHVGAYYGKLLETLSPGTVRVYHSVLHLALRAAVKDRLLTRNVAADCENRPKAPQDRSTDARAHCWTVEETRAFLKTADAAGPQPSAFYALALDTGARLRELGGLTWADVNVETGLVTIARQLSAGATAAPTFGPTKTGRTRKVLVTPETLARLLAQRRHQATIKMQHRKRYKDFGLVFAKEHAHVRRGKDSLGQPLQLNNIGEREFGALITAAGVRRIKFHGLRHTSATLALAHGEPVRDVAERLGHARASMTLDIYAHATEGRAPETLRRVLYG